MTARAGLHIQGRVLGLPSLVRVSLPQNFEVDIFWYSVVYFLGPQK